MGGQPPIRPFDPHRFLVGNDPWGFLFEVAVRGIIIYVVLLFAIRIMGKRVAGQLSMSELAVIVTLGAAIGVPMEVAENGMLPALVLLLVAVVYQRAIGFLSFKSRRVELITQGDLVAIVIDGVLDIHAMRRVGLSRERVFAALREHALVQLGEVRRVYIESSGSFSVFRYESARPGLRIVPEQHPGLRAVEGARACTSCGTTIRADEHAERDVAGERVHARAGDPVEACPACGKRDWAEAVRDGGRG
jgi:uncharacterized membrane protein YcaP (DUF421 family)